MTLHGALLTLTKNVFTTKTTLRNICYQNLQLQSTTSCNAYTVVAIFYPPPIYLKHFLEFLFELLKLLNRTKFSAVKRLARHMKQVVWLSHVQDWGNQRRFGKIP